ncbi:MAG: hypothetical protein ACOCYN_03585 [Planctomycetota bacterium]
MEKIRAAILRGSKIEAIGMYREATGCGLRDSKEAVEDIAQHLREENPDAFHKSSPFSESKSGCAPLLIVGACLALGLLGWAVYSIA